MKMLATAVLAFSMSSFFPGRAEAGAGADQASLRMRAAGVLAFGAERAADASLPRLIEMLADPDEAVAATAALALGLRREGQSQAVSALVSILTGAKGVVVGDAVVPARPLLVSAAVHALHRIGQPAMPALVAAGAATEDDGVRDLLDLALSGIDGSR